MEKAGGRMTLTGRSGVRAIPVDVSHVVGCAIAPADAVICEAPTDSGVVLIQIAWLLARRRSPLASETQTRCVDRWIAPIARSAPFAGSLSLATGSRWFDQ